MHICNALLFTYKSSSYFSSHHELYWEYFQFNVCCVKCSRLDGCSGTGRCRCDHMGSFHFLDFKILTKMILITWQRHFLTQKTFTLWIVLISRDYKSHVDGFLLFYRLAIKTLMFLKRDIILFCIFYSNFHIIIHCEERWYYITFLL